MNKQQLIKLLSNFGGLQLAKFLTRNTPRIFMYHSFSEDTQPGYVSAEQFEWQLKQIKKNFNPITLIELAQLINSHQKVPANTIVITIDDGYKNFYDVAFPLLKKYQIPATFFVTSGFIDGDLWLWPDQLKWLLKNKKNNHEKFTLLNTTFSSLTDKQKNWQQINDFCLSISDEEKYQAIGELASILDVDLPTKAPEQFAPCTWQQLTEMQKWGVEIGGHTVTHPSLGQVTIDKAEYEIKQSLLIMNQQLGERDRSFCYPNGQPTDYNDEIKAVVENAGYQCAVTAFSDSYEMNIPFAWRRYDGGKNNYEFLKSLYGIEMLGNKMNKKIWCHF